MNSAPMVCRDSYEEITEKYQPMQSTPHVIYGTKHKENQTVRRYLKQNMYHLNFQFTFLDYVA